MCVPYNCLGPAEPEIATTGRPNHQAFPQTFRTKFRRKKTNIFSSNCLKEMNNDGLVIGVLLRQLQPTQSKNVSAVTPAN